MAVVPRALPVVLLLLCAETMADDVDAGTRFGSAVQLHDPDIREITELVLISNPELASSPGVKYAEGVTGRNGSVHAGLIFYPHSNSAGVKDALQVSCSRLAADLSWTCEEPRLRRYYQLEGQDFELRVVDGLLGSAESVAVVRATRSALPLGMSAASDGSCEALSIMEAEAGYLVLWRCLGAGEENGFSMHATPISGADLTQTSSWQVSEYIFPGTH